MAEDNPCHEQRCICPPAQMLSSLLPSIVFSMRHHRSCLTLSPHVCFYDRGFSFFSFHSALRPTPDTLTTLKRTPGISPLALPFRPNPASRTSSFSSTKFKQPSFGTANIESYQYCSHRNCVIHPCPFLSILYRRTESSNLLSILYQLHSDTFSDGTVWLFGFDTDFFQHDALCV